MFKIAGYDFAGAYQTTAGLRDSAGIYVILDYRRNGKWYFLDVGESSTIKTRIDSHERRSCWEQNRQGTVQIAVRYTPTWSAAQRRLVESTIRGEHRFPCGYK